MSLAVSGIDTLIPVLGAAILLPSAMATALRLEKYSEPVTLPPALDRLIPRVLDADLDLGMDLDIDSMGRLHTEPRTTPGPDLDDDDNNSVGQNPLDTWSVVWYCGMFAAFTSLFLIMPCSQVLCRAGLLHGHGDPRLRPRPPIHRGAFHAPAHGYGTPPPPYKQFAPPSYEDVILDLDLQPPGKAVPIADIQVDKNDSKLNVYVIPLRTASDSEPPALSEGVA